MHSEFYNVALDRLRYSLVWEDACTLYGCLDIQADDRVLVITSAGCNVLNALLKSPQQVTAIDLNPVQNALLLFKKYLILQHEYAVLRALMGFDGPACVAPAFRQVAASLPTHERTYWASFFASHPAGILTAGRLETYITGFIDTVDADTQRALHQLIQFDTVDGQRTFFDRVLHPTPFREQFVQYFDEANLSKGRDPHLFKYAGETGGMAFYNRLRQQVSTTLVSTNFFFRFFFFGPQHLPETILPPCYQQQNHARLKTQLNRLTIIDGEAIDYLLSAEGLAVNKASLSNIFEYASPSEFRRVCQLLHARRNPIRFVFWNLLQEQGAFVAEDGWQDVALTKPDQAETACFYFRSRRVLEPNIHPS